MNVSSIRSLSPRRKIFDAVTATDSSSMRHWVALVPACYEDFSGPPVFRIKKLRFCCGRQKLRDIDAKGQIPEVPRYSKHIPRANVCCKV
jgi:hypothetical protein